MSGSREHRYKNSATKDSYQVSSNNQYGTPDNYQKKFTDQKIVQVQQLYQNTHLNQSISTQSQNNSSQKKTSSKVRNSINGHLNSSVLSNKQYQPLNNNRIQQFQQDNAKTAGNTFQQQNYDSILSSGKKNLSINEKITNSGSSNKNNQDIKSVYRNSSIVEQRNSHVRSFSTRQDNSVENTRKSGGGYVSSTKNDSMIKSPKRRQSNVSNSKQPFGSSHKKVSEQKRKLIQDYDMQLSSNNIQAQDSYQSQQPAQNPIKNSQNGSNSIKRTKYLKKIESHIHSKPYQKNQSSNRLGQKQPTTTSTNNNKLNQTLTGTQSQKNLQSNLTSNNFKNTTASNSNTSKYKQQNKLSKNNNISQQNLSSYNLNNQSHIQHGSSNLHQQSLFLEEGDSMLMQDISFFNNINNNINSNNIIASSKSTKQLHCGSFIQNATSTGRVQRLFKKQNNQVDNGLSKQSPRSIKNEHDTLIKSLSKSVSQQALPATVTNKLKSRDSFRDPFINTQSVVENSNNINSLNQTHASNILSQTLKSNQDANNHSNKTLIHNKKVPGISTSASQQQLLRQQQQHTPLHFNSTNHLPQNTESMIQQQTPSSSSNPSNDNYNILDSVDNFNSYMVDRSLSVGVPSTSYQKQYTQSQQKDRVAQANKALRYDEKTDQYYEIDENQQDDQQQNLPGDSSQRVITQIRLINNNNNDLISNSVSNTNSIYPADNSYPPTNKHCDENICDDDEDMQTPQQQDSLRHMHMYPMPTEMPSQRRSNSAGVFEIKQQSSIQTYRLSNNSNEQSFLGGEGGPSQFDAITVQRNIELDTILKFLIQEEEQLNNFCTMVQQGQLIELQQQLPTKFQYQYLDLIQSVDCKKERPKFFAQQLQVAIILTNTMIEIFSPALMQKFSLKLRTVYTNVHQNFLLFVDQILNCCNINPKDNLNYILLRKLIVKKLKNKLKSKRITLLRQNNEVNLLNLKKVCKHMATYGSNSQQQSNGDLSMNPFHQEYKDLGKNMLEVLRSFDKLTIQAISDKLAQKDEISKARKQQASLVSPSKRPRSIYKNQSPKASPRSLMGGQYSPAQSNKSNKSNKSGRNSITSNGSKSKFPQNKRIKPTFEDLRKDQKKSAIPNNKVSTKNTDQKRYDIIGPSNLGNNFSTIDNRQKSQMDYTHPGENTQKSQDTNPGLFFLPESMAFILSNSIECNNGITNINNNINIYNTPDIDLMKLKEDARNAKLTGKINTKTGQVEIDQTKDGMSMVKRTSYNQSRQQAVGFSKQGLSPNKKNSTKLNKSTISGITQSVKGNTNKSRQTVSRQNISRENSNMEILTNQHSLLDDDDIEKLQFNQVNFTRENSGLSQITASTKHLKSANQSPVKSQFKRPSSRQINNKQPLMIEKQKSAQQQQQPTIKVNGLRPQSRQNVGQVSSTHKALGINNRSKIIQHDNTKSDMDIKSITSTPMKSQDPDYASISNPDKNYRPILSGGKKPTLDSNISNKKTQKQNQCNVKDSLLVPTKNISIVSPQPKRNTGSISKVPGKSFIAKAVSQQKQQQEIAMRSQPKEQISCFQLNQMGLEVDSYQDGNERERFYSESNLQYIDKPITNQNYQQPQSTQNKSGMVQLQASQQPKDKYDEIFDMNENRLNSLLDKMNQDIYNQQTRQQLDEKDKFNLDLQEDSIQQQQDIDHLHISRKKIADHVRTSSISQTPKDQDRKSKLDHVLQGDDMQTSVKILQFGDLIEQHMDSLDLKREMEKLKQLDEEQKRLKRISLKINTRPVDQSNSTSANQSVNGQQTNNSIVESPGKKILMGEFDETNQEDEALYLNMGDDLLLSSDSNKHKYSQQQQNIAVEILDFEDYITQKTGMEDPFPDHVDPDEEGTHGLSTRRQQDQQAKQPLSDEDVARRSIDEENSRLRQQVKIPYLPGLGRNEYHNTYTLVLDLDETLIHFECDEEAQDEDEQGYYLIRPGAIKFLNELSKYYELVIFTAAMPDYADWILDNVDRHKIIKHRLYRQHTTPHEDYAIKDLRNLGRALERTIIIDNLAENFIHTTPDNGIWVESWYDDMDDTVMDQLIPFLKEIVTSRVPDVRKVLTKTNKEDIIYRCLEENKDLPPVQELLDLTDQASPKSGISYTPQD